MKQTGKKKYPSTKTVESKTLQKQFDFKSLLIVAVAIISYGLSVFNNYALDDFIVLVKNHFTQQGFAGIWNILSKDTFAGMTDQNISVLTGGRYRPLSLVTFAIEQEFFHGNVFISHLINVLLYAITGIVLYNFLKKLQAPSLKDSWLQISFFTSVLFMALPAHSESVLNIKGRDDLMCLLFFLLSAMQIFRYLQTSEIKNLILAGVLFFLSLLSKESAITFVAVIPLLLFIFSNTSKQKIINTTLVYAVLAGLFILIRFMVTAGNHGIVNEDILNNPFIHATSTQKFATIFYTWLMYLKLLILPIHLSYDYNFNHIPLTNFFDPFVLISIVIHVVLFFTALLLLKRKSIFSFAILFYLITFSIVSNLFFNIGTPFADRFIFTPSIGFCLGVVALIFSIRKIKNDEKNQKIFQNGISVLFSVVILLFVIRNINRCDDWKDNNTLFIHDAGETQNSAKVQLNAGIAYINLAEEKPDDKKNELLENAFIHLQKGISIYPDYVDGYINMGVAYFRKGDIEHAEVWWNKAKTLKPSEKKVRECELVLSAHYFQQGLKSGIEKKLPESINSLLHSLKYDSLNSDILFNLGGAYYTISKPDSAAYYWTQTLKINPDHQEAKKGMMALHKQFN